MVAKGKTGLPIRKWIAEEQPQAILLLNGAQALSPAKLLAIILRTGARGTNAEELSRKLLNEFQGLRGIDCASIEELCAFSGIAAQRHRSSRLPLRSGKDSVGNRPENGNALKARVRLWTMLPRITARI